MVLLVHENFLLSYQMQASMLVAGTVALFRQPLASPRQPRVKGLPCRHMPETTLRTFLGTDA